MKAKSIIILAIYKFCIIVGLFSSCRTPSEKLAVLLKKHPELAKRDTIFRNDTLIINSNSKDTLFNFSTAKDTVVLKDGRLTVKYFYYRDSVFLKGDCAADTIIKEVPVYINDVQPEPEKETKFEWWWVAAILAIVLILTLLIKR